MGWIVAWPNNSKVSVFCNFDFVTEQKGHSMQKWCQPTANGHHNMSCWTLNKWMPDWKWCIWSASNRVTMLGNSNSNCFMTRSWLLSILAPTGRSSCSTCQFKFYFNQFLLSFLCYWNFFCCAAISQSSGKVRWLWAPAPIPVVGRPPCGLTAT